MSDSLDKLLDLLDLEQIEVNIFRGRSPDETMQRVFGGQVAGQARQRSRFLAGLAQPASAAQVQVQGGRR